MKISQSISFALFACALSTSCYVADVSNESSIKKGTIITLSEPYYFIDNPGDDQLVAVRNFTELASYSKSKVLLPKGTKVQYLRTIKEDVFMAPMARTTSYGRVVGMKGMRKVNIDALLRSSGFTS